MPGLQALEHRLQKLQVLGHTLAQQLILFSATPALNHVARKSKRGAKDPLLDEGLLLGFEYLSSPAAHEEKIKGNPSAAAADAALASQLSPCLPAFLAILRGINMHGAGLKRCLDGIVPGSDILGAEAVLGRGGDSDPGPQSLQVLVEAVCFHGFLLVLLDHLLPGLIRERLLVAAYRQHQASGPATSASDLGTQEPPRRAIPSGPTRQRSSGERSGLDAVGTPPWTDFDAMCQLCRRVPAAPSPSGWFGGGIFRGSTGEDGAHREGGPAWLATHMLMASPGARADSAASGACQKIPAEGGTNGVSDPFGEARGWGPRRASVMCPTAAHELFERFPMPAGVVKELIGCAMRSDLYNALPFFPSAQLDPMQRARALSAQAGQLALLLFWAPELLASDKVWMEAVVERHLGGGRTWVVPLFLGFSLDLKIAWSPFQAARAVLGAKLGPAAASSTADSVAEQVAQLLPAVVRQQHAFSEAAEMAEIGTATGNLLEGAESRTNTGSEPAEHLDRVGANDGEPNSGSSVSEISEHAAASNRASPGDGNGAELFQRAQGFPLRSGSVLRRLVRGAHEVVQLVRSASVALSWLLCHMGTGDPDLRKALFRVAADKRLLTKAALEDPPPTLPASLASFISGSSAMWMGSQGQGGGGGAGGLLRTMEGSRPEEGGGLLLVLLLRTARLEQQACQLYGSLAQCKPDLIQALQREALRQLAQIQVALAVHGGGGSGQAPAGQAASLEAADEGDRPDNQQIGLGATRRQAQQMNGHKEAPHGVRGGPKAVAKARGVMDWLRSIEKKLAGLSLQGQGAAAEEAGIVAALEEAGDLHHFAGNPQARLHLQEAIEATRDMGFVRESLGPSLLRSLRRVSDGGYLWGTALGVLCPKGSAQALVYHRPAALVQIGALWSKLAEALDSPAFFRGMPEDASLVGSVPGPQLWCRQQLAGILQLRVVAGAAQLVCEIMRETLDKGLLPEPEDEVPGAGPLSGAVGTKGRSPKGGEREGALPGADGAPVIGADEALAQGEKGPGDEAHKYRHLLQLEAKAAQLVSGILKLDGMELGQRTVLRAVDLYLSTIETFLHDRIHSAVNQFQPLDSALSSQAAAKSSKGQGKGSKEALKDSGEGQLADRLAQVHQSLGQLKACLLHYSVAVQVRGAAMADDVLEAWVHHQFAKECSLIRRRRATVPLNQGPLSPDELQLAVRLVARLGLHEDPDTGATSMLWSSFLGPRSAPQSNAVQSQGKRSAIRALLGAILRLTAPGESLYLPPLLAWYDVHGKERMGLRLLHALGSTLGPAALAGLAQVVELQRAWVADVAIAGLLDAWQAHHGLLRSAERAFSGGSEVESPAKFAAIILSTATQIFPLGRADTRKGAHGATPERGHKRAAHPAALCVASLGQIQLLQPLVHHELTCHGTPQEHQERTDQFPGDGPKGPSSADHSQVRSARGIGQAAPAVGLSQARPAAKEEYLVPELPDGFWEGVPLLLCMLLLAHAQCFRHDAGLSVPVPRSAAGSVDAHALGAGVAALLCEGAMQAEQGHGGRKRLLWQLVRLLQRWTAALMPALASDGTKDKDTGLVVVWSWLTNFELWALAD